MTHWLSAVKTLLAIALPAICTLCRAAAAEQAVNFSRDVRPILSSNCLKCHGLDETSRKAHLRLDVRTGAIGSGTKSGKPAIVPGKPDESGLIHRIFSTDPDFVMPPASTKLALSQSQKEVLRHWIAQGANYATHWSFVAPVQAPLPAVKQRDWQANPIDRFILARLEAGGLKPSPQADRYTLIRRVSLDLIGLPPTPAKADAFVNDPAPDAYERLVDRLLANPHYGERWARRWLDLARYADTNGFEKDRPRSIWPYRDWVINALNADMPFDQFTIEQLAGDMLPGATPSQRIATGFHRNTMLNEEGGIDPLEYRFRSVIDRNNTTGTTWLGLTVGCAQCHTHKFDPITQTEYYRLMAFLNNADEPQMEVPNAAIASRRAATEAKIAALAAQLPEKFPIPKAAQHLRTAVEKTDDGSETEVEADIGPGTPREALDRALSGWIERQSRQAVKWTILRPNQMRSTMPILTLQDDGSVLAGGDVTKSDTYDLTFGDVPRGITAVRLEALPDDSLPNHGPGMVYYEGTPGDFFLSEISLGADGHADAFNKASQSFADGKFTAANAIDGDPQTGWSVKGGQGEAHVAIFGLVHPIAGARELKLRLHFERYFAAPLGHFRISVSTDPRAADSSPLPADVEAALTTPTAQRTAGQQSNLLRYFLSVAPELAGARKEMDQLRQSLPNLPTTLVLSERAAGHDRPTFVHHRGEFLQASEKVAPGVPAFQPPLPKGAPANRLTFARWLVSPENPLTARVTVNRQWQAFFGRGIVGTLGDFGYQGDLPTHPELLDWLAVQFMKDGWSLKKLDRLIVTSSAYRQSSKVTPESLARDPQDLLLTRAARFRIEAELIRDSALSAAGLLSNKMGGPSVFPPQPPSVTTEGAYGELPWIASTGEERYRRSIYTYSKRTAPFAIYNAFDAPPGEQCLARREISDTPLQALTLLNDQVFMEAAQALGETWADTKGSDEARAGSLFRRCATRPPDKQELALLVDFARRQRKSFEGDTSGAARIAGSDEGDIVERATGTALARAILNLDEVVTRE